MSEPIIIYPPDSPEASHYLALPTGPQGPAGPPGPPGPQGPAGPPGDGDSAVTSVNTRTGAVVLNKSDVGLSNVDNTADAAKPVSAATATALAGKANTGHTHVVAEVTGLQTALDAKAATGHTHTTDQVTEGSNLYHTAARVLAVVLTGLSIATNAAITATDTVLTALGKLQRQITDNLTTLTTHTSNTANPHAVTKAQVGLWNADNTADADKPISTAVATALSGKADASHGHTFASLSSKPTTVGGYGITDAYPLAGNPSGFLTPGTVANSGLTMATARLLGRTSASAGAIEEITIGSGLSLSGGVLSASGVGGSSAWSALTDPSANLALATGANTSTFTASAATGAAHLWTWRDTANNNGTGYLVSVETATGSTLNPLRVQSRGANSFVVGYAAGNVNTHVFSPVASAASSVLVSSFWEGSSTNGTGFKLESFGQIGFVGVAQAGLPSTRLTSGRAFNATASAAGAELRLQPSGAWSVYVGNGSANFTPISGDANGNTIIGTLQLNDGTVKTVTFGAADSGGVGYKLLRVAN